SYPRVSPRFLPHLAKVPHDLLSVRSNREPRIVTRFDQHLKCSGSGRWALWLDGVGSRSTRRRRCSRLSARWGRTRGLTRGYALGGRFSLLALFQVRARGNGRRGG